MTMPCDAEHLFQAQYEAFRRGCAIVRLKDWSSVTLTGADRYKFLHNFCTNDIKGLRPGDTCEAFFLNVKGKILGHGLISCRDDALVVCGEPGQSPTLISHLDRYLIREAVELRDTTAERCYVFVAGGMAAKRIIDAIRGASGVIAAVIDCNLTGSEFQRVLETSAEGVPELIRLAGELGAISADAAFHAARIEVGTPLFGVDFGDEHLPQEIGRDRQAICFTKGCYLGQETVARVDALGHVNQQLAGVSFMGATIPCIGDSLTANAQEVGRVTSAAYSPKLAAPLALAMLRRTAAAPGTRLTSLVGECEVVSLPLHG